MSGSFDYYDIVRVRATAEHPAAQYAGGQGVVVGISPGEPAGYGVLLDDLERVVMFDAGQLEPTGRRARPEDVYG